jgi:signal transduction histidine kinase
MDAWLESFALANFARSADTAHDLKTPLNVAVLNLELLRMRLRKLNEGEDDEKLANYARAIEGELRRMGKIFDAFFLLSTPPKGEGAPARIDVASIATESAGSHGYDLDKIDAAVLTAHESRIRQAFKMLFEGASKLLKPERRNASSSSEGGTFRLEVTGELVSDDFEPTKIFKFYYSGPDGESDLSLAAARLIVETYGGELNATQENDKVSLRLSLPLDER